MSKTFWYNSSHIFMADRLLDPLSCRVYQFPEVIGISARMTSASPFWSMPVIPLKVPFEWTSWSYWVILKIFVQNLKYTVNSVSFSLNIKLLTAYFTLYFLGPYTLNPKFTHRSKYILIMISQFNELISEIQKQFQFFY